MTGWQRVKAAMPTDQPWGFQLNYGKTVNKWVARVLPLGKETIGYGTTAEKAVADLVWKLEKK